MSVESTTESHTAHTASHGGGHGGTGSFVKTHKPLVIGGGALVAVLLLSHKGSKASGSTTDPATTATNAAAEQQAIDSAIAAQAASGAVVPGNDTSLSGDPTGTGGTGTTANPTLGPVNIYETPGPTPSKPAAAAKKKTTKHPAKGKGHKGGATAATKNHGATIHNSHGAKAHAPASKNPKKHTAKPKPTVVAHKNAVSVHGRAFPGAVSAHVGPAMRSPGGNVHNVVKLDMGGYTVAHTSHNNGAAWSDHAAGHSPPSRPAHPHVTPQRRAAAHR